MSFTIPSYSELGGTPQMNGARHYKIFPHSSTDGTPGEYHVYADGEKVFIPTISEAPITTTTTLPAPAPAAPVAPTPAPAPAPTPTPAAPAPSTPQPIKPSGYVTGPDNKHEWYLSQTGSHANEWYYVEGGFNNGRTGVYHVYESGVKVFVPGGTNPSQPSSNGGTLAPDSTAPIAPVGAAPSSSSNPASDSGSTPSNPASSSDPTKNPANWPDQNHQWKFNGTKQEYYYVDDTPSGNHNVPGVDHVYAKPIGWGQFREERVFVPGGEGTIPSKSSSEVKAISTETPDHTQHSGSESLAHTGSSNNGGGSSHPGSTNNGIGSGGHPGSVNNGGGSIHTGSTNNGSGTHHNGTGGLGYGDGSGTDPNARVYHHPDDHQGAEHKDNTKFNTDKMPHLSTNPQDPYNTPAREYPHPDDKHNNQTPNFTTGPGHSPTDHVVPWEPPKKNTRGYGDGSGHVAKDPVETALQNPTIPPTNPLDSPHQQGRHPGI
ncbi:MAG: hypothetical protein ACXWLH_05795 [Candidatus Saccharimonadales bacterium]